MAPTIDVIIPARDEAVTVARVVEACRACVHAREVIVVDDGSTDGTADAAAAAGAKVVRREGDAGLRGPNAVAGLRGPNAVAGLRGPNAVAGLRDPNAVAGGSKAQALETGVAASDADAFLFCDADLLGLTGSHLDAVCRPWLEGRAALSVGWFDYGLWNALVLRLPPTTGERLVPRWVWDSVPPEKRRGYDIEVMVNEVIAEGRLPSTARILHGVTHRTKRAKWGRRRGYRETWRMFWHLIGLPTFGVVRWRTYWFYLRQLTVED